MSDTIKKVEALLFAVGRTISEKELSELSSISVTEIHDSLKELKKQYQERESPLLIIEEGDGWKLTVHEKYLSIVQQINPHTELSKAILETLAVIAWKQPATQSEVIKIRTNKAYEHIDELEKLGYVAKHKHGRTYLLKVTGKFYDYFDLPGESGVREIFKDVKDVEEAQTKLLDQEIEKEVGLELYESGEPEKSSMPKEKLGELEVFEDVEPAEETEEETESSFAEEATGPKEENPVEDFLQENKSRPAPQEVEEGLTEEKESVSEESEETSEEPEERELDPALEKLIEKKKK
jgi:segregation and condensation protein B